VHERREGATAWRARQRQDLARRRLKRVVISFEHILRIFTVP